MDIWWKPENAKYLPGHEKNGQCFALNRFCDLTAIYLQKLYSMRILCLCVLFVCSFDYFTVVNVKSRIKEDSQLKSAIPRRLIRKLNILEFFILTANSIGTILWL